MANHACIAIGINRYQFFQPLSYAEADAQALRQFLVEEAGLPPNRCLLLTDTSPPVGDRLTYPRHEQLLEGIESWCQQTLQPGDWLWFFFSGYGVSVNDEDYLMPIDGNPADIAATGIPMRSLYKQLQAQGAERVLVLLDMNRSQGMQSGVKVGQETVELARNLGIATVLSCQPDQFSHEAASLGHGLFTATLLEALHYDPDMTLEGLELYLRDRLPELSEHHWQPVQNSVTVIPSPEASHQMILPLVEMNWGDEISESNGSATTSLPDTQLQGNIATAAPVSVVPAPAATGAPVPNQAALVHAPTEESSPEEEETPWWIQLLLWGGGTILVLGMIVGVCLKVVNQQQKYATSAIKPSPATTDPKASSSPTQTANPSPTLLPAQPFTTTPTATTDSTARLKANQASLDKAKRLIQSSQASRFNDAIEEAQNIKPGDPLYEQAQQNINRWSRVILDLAEGRAKQGDFSAAIAAAELVPVEQPAAADAQKAIARWKEQASQQRANQIILKAAKGLIRPGQASSYNQAITAANKILPDQPGYAEARQLITQWSRAIYLIAQSRASRGEFKAAITTASLVPENTPSSEATQKAIVKWKQGKR